MEQRLSLQERNLWLLNRSVTGRGKMKCQQVHLETGPLGGAARPQAYSSSRRASLVVWSQGNITCHCGKRVCANIGDSTTRPHTQRRLTPIMSSGGTLTGRVDEDWTTRQALQR